MTHMNIKFPKEEKLVQTKIKGNGSYKYLLHYIKQNQPVTHSVQLHDKI